VSIITSCFTFQQNHVLLTELDEVQSCVDLDALMVPNFDYQFRPRGPNRVISRGKSKYRKVVLCWDHPCESKIISRFGVGQCCKEFV